MATVYIGTYTKKEGHVDGQADGIYVFRLSESGELSFVTAVPGVINPSFVTMSPDGRFLYAVNEIGPDTGQPAGLVTAFAIDQTSGGLTLLNSQSTHGYAPCHLSVDQTGHYLLVTNYSGGNLALFPLGNDGRLGAAAQIIQHQGQSINPGRQEGPHPHSINIAPGNQFALVPDLGTDKIWVYRLDLEEGHLVANDPPWTEVTPGSGPRHFTFHPNGRIAYVINELDSTITAFSWDGDEGTLEPLQSVSTLPTGFNDESWCADIHIHPVGHTLYGSNRGHDSIVVFRVNQETGELTLLGHESTQGNTPRNFAIDPTGQFLIAANQDSSSIVSYHINVETGELRPTGQLTAVATPVCIIFN